MEPITVYKKFVTDRDQALEKIYLNYRLRINDEIRSTFADIAFAFQNGHAPNDNALVMSAIKCQGLMDNMFSSVYKLSGASEAEILGRIFNRHTTWSPKVPERENQYAKKLYYNLRKIVRKLQNLQDLSSVEDRDLSAQEIFSAFPKMMDISSKPILKKVREAGRKPIDVSMSQIDDEEWDDILSDYKDDYALNNRGPEEILGIRGSSKSSEKVYSWEVERDATHDFVLATRQGMTDAATKNGIKEFVWIAVIDNRTCDCTGCCLPRDGLTTSEIERLLKTRWKKSEYRTSVPPAHINCRCTLAPVTKDLPPVPTSKIGDFLSWLES